MTPRLHNCQKQPPPAGGGALSWSFPGRARPPDAPYGEPPSWRLRNPRPCRDRFHETPARAVSAQPTHTLYPFARIGGRVRRRFAFSHVQANGGVCARMICRTIVWCALIGALVYCGEVL